MKHLLDEAAIAVTRKKIVELEQLAEETRARLNADAPAAEATLRSIYRMLRQMREEIILSERKLGLPVSVKPPSL